MKKRIHSLFNPVGSLNRLDFFINTILINLISLCIGLLITFILYIFIDINIWQKIKSDEILGLGQIFMIPIGYFNVSKRINDIAGKYVNKFVNAILFSISFIPIIGSVFYIFLLFKPSKTEHSNKKEKILLLIMGIIIFLFLLLCLAALLIPLFIK